MSSRLSRFLKPSLFLIVSLVGSTILLYFASKRPSGLLTSSGKANAGNYSANSPRSASSTRMVSALGYLRPEGDVIALASPLQDSQGGQVISRLYVKEGQPVRKGDILIDFNTLELVQAERTGLIGTMSAIQRQINLLEKETKRYESLVAKSAYPQSDLENRQFKLLELMTKKREVESEIAKADVRLRLARLYSPVNGRVIRINSMEGERSTAAGLIELRKSLGMEAIVQVDEQDISRIRVGQLSQIVSENGSFKGSASGKVSFVSSRVGSRRRFSSDPSLESDSEQRVFEVRIRIEPSSSLPIQKLIGAKVVAKIMV